MILLVQTVSVIKSGTIAESFAGLGHCVDGGVWAVGDAERSRAQEGGRGRRRRWGAVIGRLVVGHFDATIGGREEGGTLQCRKITVVPERQRPQTVVRSHAAERDVEIPTDTNGS